MHSSQTDEELLARSATDPSEFAVLYERHGLAVRLYVRRRVGSQNADDLAAEVFARAFGHESIYLMAQDGDRLCGVLPLVYIHSVVFGRSLTSLPTTRLPLR